MIQRLFGHSIGTWLAIIISSLILYGLTGCNDSSECTNCGGGPVDGFLYKRVTQEDLSQLGSIEDITLDTCIRFQFIDMDEFDLESIEIVDDCCCDQYDLSSGY